ncbi:MAG: hypothetical protein M3Z10_12495 [Gemmatimonadota bacterium]|nr:hypothetical protein [Gemmatimonadota bacterium]
MPPTDPGRVVVVAAGFALWTGGRCIAAARWSDVRHLRAYHRERVPTPPLYLGVELVDGSVMELREEAPGFDAFLDRASVVLSGLLPYAAWHPTLASRGTIGEGVVIFEREGRR